MRKAKVFVNGTEAGVLTEVRYGSEYVFEYLDGYDGPEISVTMGLVENSAWKISASTSCSLSFATSSSDMIPLFTATSFS